MSEEYFEVPIRCTGIATVLLKKIEDEYKVLLLKRNTSVLRNVWCYIGGSIEEGEKAWEAAFREINEETGITNVLLYASNKFDQYIHLKKIIYMLPLYLLDLWKTIKM
ncbi:NUDIX domain-containing protein [Viridibacillus sp. FSL H8-0110]|uniref:NUDIX domain-containing protein n=1 Tax=Viridibacillus sp. FSL H8-0110 TaxID=2921376 RepID=UPI0030FCB33F